MTLYAADVMDVAKPVKKLKVVPPKPEETPTTAPKKRQRKKASPAEPEPQLPPTPPPTPQRKRKVKEAVAQPDPVTPAEPPKKKRVMSEKQKEALAEARKRKKEKVLDTELDKAVEEVTAEPAKPVKERKPRKKYNPEDPPKWFQKYLEGVKREQDQKKPVKQIQQEAEVEAKSKWENGMVRDRVRNEVDSHMNRMYSMIFNR
jgi:hypothetical protein